MDDEVEECYIGKELEEHQEILKRLESIEIAIKKFDQHQRTIMVGWNSFIEHAGMHLNNLFRGKIPAPLLRKMMEASFRDESKHAKSADQ